MLYAGQGRVLFNVRTPGLPAPLLRLGTTRCICARPAMCRRGGKPSATLLCLPQIRSAARSRHAKPETRYFDPRFGPKQMHGAREIHGEIGNQEEVSLVPGKQNRLGSKSRNWARTAAIRLRVARSGGEARQLEVWKLRRRVLASARVAVPAGPWPATDGSWIRDNTPGRTSYDGTAKPH
jgi:hypothetical protein